MKAIVFVKFIFSVFFLMSTLLLTQPAYADSSTISKQQAISAAQQASPGRVLSVKLKEDVYLVKTLNAKGDVRVISIDANTGKVVGQ